MNLRPLTVTAVVLLSSSLFAENQGDKSEVNSYKCTIVKYESEKSSNTKDAIAPFSKARNGKNDPVPADAIKTGEGDEEISWRITRHSNLFSIEVANADDLVLSISTVVDGNPIGVTVPSTRNILTCNPPKAATKLNTNPEAYGASVRIYDFDSEKLPETLSQIFPPKLTNEPLSEYKTRAIAALTDLLGLNSLKVNLKNGKQFDTGNSIDRIRRAQLNFLITKLQLHTDKEFLSFSLSEEKMKLLKEEISRTLDDSKE